MKKYINEEKLTIEEIPLQVFQLLESLLEVVEEIETEITFEKDD